MAAPHQMKVTLVSGFLGSGKTSLLSHVLTNKDHKMKCAVIVNEISEFNVDALAVENAQLLQSEEKMVEMSNGCICCTLREDLLEQLTSLHAKGFNAALIESSGIAEPMQVAETFFFPTFDKDKDGNKIEASEPKFLQQIAPLDNCVTVVDAGNLLHHMQSIDSTHLFDKNARGTEDDRNIATLMFDQLEFANVVLLNKVDMIDKATEILGKPKGSITVDTLVQLIKKINPHCEVISTNHSKVDLNKIINTGNFTEEFATRTQGWMDDVKTGLKHVPETEEYGVSSVAFTPKRPFHPQRLWDWIRRYFILEEILVLTPSMIKQREEDAKKNPVTEEEEAAKKEAWAKDVAGRSEARIARYGNLFRGKGYAWVGQPKRSHVFVMWGQAGNTLSFGSQGTWKEFPQNTSREPIEVEPGQRLVFIGQDLNKKQLVADLEEILLTEVEFGQLKKALERPLRKGEEDMDRPDIFVPDPWGPFEVAEEEVEEGHVHGPACATGHCDDNEDDEDEWEEFEEEDEDEEEEEEEQDEAALAAGEKRQQDENQADEEDVPQAKRRRTQ